jgi:hypothetical protein
MNDEITIHNDENKPVRMKINVTAQRVEHYKDVIDSMTRTEVERCRKDGFEPTPSQIAFYQKELVRTMTISRKMDAAFKIHIPKSNVLKG